MIYIISLINYAILSCILALLKKLGSSDYSSH